MALTYTVGAARFILENIQYKPFFLPFVFQVELCRVVVFTNMLQYSVSAWQTSGIFCGQKRLKLFPKKKGTKYACRSKIARRPYNTLCMKKGEREKEREKV